MWNDSFTSHLTCEMTRHIPQKSAIINGSFVGNDYSADLFPCETWLFPTWLIPMWNDMTYSHVKKINYSALLRNMTSLLWEMTCNLRHPMGLRLPVLDSHLNVGDEWVKRTQVQRIYLSQERTRHISLVKKVMFHMGISHVNYVYTSCHTCKCVTSNEWRNTWEVISSKKKITSRVCMRHASYVNDWCHTCEWIMSHMWMSRVRRVNDV